ncbi:MAG: hypothetical protein H0T73_16445, partial [Ardenticatenales bacterium]|nr:hypothetical protein [Ardenticatenales bacterium]
PERMEVDLLWGSAPWVKEALAHPRQDGAGYPVLDLPYLILMKIEASRAVDFGELTRMLGLASDEELGRVREVIKKYASDAVDDLESLIYLGKLEMGRL